MAPEENTLVLFIICVPERQQEERSLTEIFYCLNSDPCPGCDLSQQVG